MIVQNKDKIDEAKKAAALKALEYVKEGMLLGIGTGSTVYYFIEALAESGLKVQSIATSRHSENLAKKQGIPLLNAENITKLDLVVDGADQIDSDFRMIKGGGGALLREKIAAKMASDRIIIVDSKKIVTKLGKCNLPLEILSWGRSASVRELNNLGLQGKWRDNFLSDNGNPIFDVELSDSLDYPEEMEDKIIRIPGVIATGFFFNLASLVCVGYPDKKVEVL